MPIHLRRLSHLQDWCTAYICRQAVRCDLWLILSASEVARFSASLGKPTLQA